MDEIKRALAELQASIEQAAALLAAITERLSDPEDSSNGEPDLRTGD